VRSVNIVYAVMSTGMHASQTIETLLY